MKNYDDVIGATFSKLFIDERDTVYLGGFWRDIAGEIQEVNVVTDFDWGKNCLYINGAKKRKQRLERIKLNTNTLDGFEKYLHFNFNSDSYGLGNKVQTRNSQTMFTRKETNEFLKNEPAGVWSVEEVEDQ